MTMKWSIVQKVKSSNAGEIIFVRPDPQVIWDTEKKKGWRKMNGHYHRSSKGGGRMGIFPASKRMHHSIFLWKDAPDPVVGRWLCQICRAGNPSLNHYDAIIIIRVLRSHQKGKLKIEESVYPLIQLCSQILTDNPLFFLMNRDIITPSAALNTSPSCLPDMPPRPARPIFCVMTATIPRKLQKT